MERKVIKKKLINLIVPISAITLRVLYLLKEKKIRQNIISKNICVSIKQLAISGDDMIKLGYSGKQIREKLEFALEAVITGKANNSKEELLSILTRESLN